MDEGFLNRNDLIGRFRENPSLVGDVLECTGCAVLVLDSRLRILSQNRTAERWFPQGAERAPEDRKCHHALLGCQEPCRTGPPGKEGPCPAVRALSSRAPEGPDLLPRRFLDGNEQYLESRAVPLADGRGEVDFILEILRDVTSEKLLALYREESNLRDPLTGLYNRKAFHQVLDREQRRARRQGHPVSLCLLDLDSFKDFNERVGNEAGDEFLASLGRILVAQTRHEVDNAFRIESDTFCLILPETDSSQAFRIAERIRSALAATGEPVTASLAICQAKPDETAEDFYRRAGDRLFLAKKAGGDRIL